MYFRIKYSCVMYYFSVARMTKRIMCMILKEIAEKGCNLSVNTFVTFCTQHL